VADARVVPPVEQDLAVVQDDRMKVVVLVEAQLPHARPVGVHRVQVGDPLGGLAVPAGHALVRGRAAEDDPAVGQVTGVEAVHVPGRPGDLPQARPVGPEFPDLPVLGIAPGEEQPVGVPVEVHLADVTAALGAVKRLEPAVGTDGRQDGDLVIPAVPFQRRVALVVGGESQGVPFAALDLAFDEEEPVEVQERIGEQRLALERAEVARDLGRRPVPCLLERIEPLKVRRTAGVGVAERLRQVLDGQAQGLEVGRRRRAGRRALLRRAARLRPRRSTAAIRR